MCIGCIDFVFRSHSKYQYFFFLLTPSFLLSAPFQFYLSPFSRISFHCTHSYLFHTMESMCLLTDICLGIDGILRWGVHLWIENDLCTHVDAWMYLSCGFAYAFVLCFDRALIECVPQLIAVHPFDFHDVVIFVQSISAVKQSTYMARGCMQSVLANKQWLFHFRW